MRKLKLTTVAICLALVVLPLAAITALAFSGDGPDTTRYALARVAWAASWQLTFLASGVGLLLTAGLLGRRITRTSVAIAILSFAVAVGARSFPVTAIVFGVVLFLAMPVALVEAHRGVRGAMNHAVAVIRQRPLPVLAWFGALTAGVVLTSALVPELLPSASYSLGQGHWLPGGGYRYAGPSTNWLTAAYVLLLRDWVVVAIGAYASVSVYLRLTTTRAPKLETTTAALSNAAG